jgi:hypothetical protein
MSARIAIHEDPVWRAEANFIIRADLSQWGLDGWEQLWAKQTRSDEFIICCIPFFTYGIALGDTVRTATIKGMDYVVSEVRARSGRRVVRLWFKNAMVDGRSEVSECVRKHSLLHEVNVNDLMAIDIPDDAATARAVCATIEKTAKAYSIDLEYGD